MMREIPADIQALICRFAIGSAHGKFPFVAMRVCKAWAHTVCSELYRHRHVGNYLQFIGLVETVTSPNRLLPYGTYIHYIDLTPINKYGIDMRAERLIRHCPNLLSITLGHPTSVKTATIQMLVQQCRQLRSLQLGGFESFPFMLDCDFSGLQSIRHLSLYACPLQSSSLQTLPSTIESLTIGRMEALSPVDLKALVEKQPRLRYLKISGSRQIMNDLHGSLGNALQRLEELSLFGGALTDDGLVNLCSVPARLRILRICDSGITDVAVEALLAGELKADHYHIAGNRYFDLSLLKDSEIQNRLTMPPCCTTPSESLSVPLSL